MFASLLITFRETLEAALVVGVVLSFLAKTHQEIYNKFVWRGVVIGCIAAIGLALFINIFLGEFEEPYEQMFEGTLLFITAGFLTWMIMWVHRQKNVAEKLREKVAKHAKEGYGMGILILVATSVFREGTETVLYIKASSLLGQTQQFLGAVFGIGAALLLSYAIFRSAVKANISIVFTVTNVFLLLFAAGLVLHGVHEFQEIGMLPLFSFDPVFSTEMLLSQESVAGSFLNILFGYTSQPTFIELFSYMFYIVLILLIEQMAEKMQKS